MEGTWSCWTRFTPSRWSFKADLNFELFRCYLLTLDLTSVRLLMLLCNKVVIHSFIHLFQPYLPSAYLGRSSQPVLGTQGSTVPSVCRCPRLWGRRALSGKRWSGQLCLEGWNRGR